MLLLFSVFTLATIISGKTINSKLRPLHCQIITDREIGTFCDFRSAKGSHRDTSSIIAHPTNSFGDTVDKNFVRSIRFDQSTFFKFPSSIFTFFPTVWDVKFSVGKIQSIHKGNFKNAGDLQHIEFFNSQINELSPRGFEGAVNLREISFRQCKIDSITQEAFFGLPNLKVIRLTGSQFDLNKMNKALPGSLKVVIMP